MFLLPKVTLCSFSSNFCWHVAKAAAVPASITSPSSTGRQSCQRSSSGESRWQAARGYRRGYSTRPPPPAPDNSTDDAEAHAKTWPKTAHPTPYEIFDQRPGSPYSKARFYQLAKLYHPDRYRHHHRHHPSLLSPATKLERYRLVVAANDILSDPVKRRAYDLTGAGWGDKTDHITVARARYKSWRMDPGTAAYNATWEDWERWNQRRNGEKQTPVFMSNGGFVVIVFAFAVVGFWAQLARMDSNSARFVDDLDHKHNDISRGMIQRQVDTALLNREERVQHFLRQREGWGYEDEYPRAPTQSSGSKDE